MRFDVVTLFPEMFEGYLGEGLLSKAISKGLIEVRLHSLRQWATRKHQKVDDRPYGGGPGMLLQVEPVVTCVESVLAMDSRPAEIILLSPQGERLRQPLVEQFSKLPRMLLICGRYEGFDHRIIEILKPRQVSLGDFVLNGGEVAAMAIIDAAMRLVPGTLGDEQSAQLDSFSFDHSGLEYPQYTRPREYRGHVVPDVLLNGHHEEIEKWRAEQSRVRTEEMRE
ncbi:MAG: tRNA (guanosine(37)-N1)-methyltransferase TrmD [Planctomycetaceae bacterium]|nr:tRNA (guanosine(37)-N1)-methyltransferase TrmD [Planctomycetaceae bacterium]MBN8599470.1 tRNA (guanosine(37)-N1)-methyltransferase TrmD [Planctomycetota bacterium]